MTAVETGLVRYDAMCQAIAECHDVDEAKHIRDKAKALAVYAREAKNFEAERKATEIRIRAERRAGELIGGMRQNGTLQKQAQPVKNLTSRPPRLNDLGITYDQSSQWQQLAAVPAEEFEKAISSPGGKPTTEGIINAHILKHNPAPAVKVSNEAVTFWGILRDFDRKLMSVDPATITETMTDSMREDCERILPEICKWLKRCA
jgi:hypothetical protein